VSLVSHGFFVWMNSLHVSMNAKISFKALSSSKLLIYVSIFFRFSFLISWFVVSWILYFSARAEVRETRLPSLFASSLLWRSTRACSEKSPSSPVANGNCLMQKYLTVSAPYFLTSVIGEIVFPRDFDIF